MNARRWAVLLCLLAFALLLLYPDAGLYGAREGEEQQPIPKEERRMFLKGAMKATLLIGLAYLAGLGVCSVAWEDGAEE